ncbi:MAG: VTT domain-containing protein [Bacteroidales bacterium]|nr:VTT domain-containing protein [Bacteroidales bacterium]
MASGQKERILFLLRNLMAGLLWLGGIILIFWLSRHFLGLDFQHLINQHADEPLFVFGTFLVSEVVFGIIPPEIFMVWAAGSEDLAPYPVLMLMLASISYFSGISGYLIGHRLHPTRFYRWLDRRILGKYLPVLKRYGSFLIIVAALTPIPFSAICMLVGAIEYPFRKFLAYASFRILRFTLYAWVMQQVSLSWFLI